MREQQHPDDSLRWVRRLSVLAVLLIGWAFILATNNLHITPSVVFACLGYFAAVAAIYTLYRTGATAVTANDEEDDDQSWGRPLGALGELEREKRTLLKAIKEAEFDQQMGKLSKADADGMIAIYRARAIEVIKEIEIQSSTGGKVGSVRDRILREARARIQIETKAEDTALAKKKDKKADGKKSRADKLADAITAVKGKQAADPPPADAASTTDAAVASGSPDTAPATDSTAASATPIEPATDETSASKEAAR
ncbi:MAG TPA: hypothetical protein VK427_09980 [Kofleriaceae bacterium]|nr:hypothetical protein [Kofleriaceae bacterium]